MVTFVKSVFQAMKPFFLFCDALVALSNPSTLTSLFNKDPLEMLLCHSVNIIFTAYKTNLTNETFYILRMEL